MIKRCLFAFLALALIAAAPPRDPGADAHIQTRFYNPGEVTTITGAVGWQIMIEFAADERIENVSIGDSNAWQVTPNRRARMLFVKPLSRTASTNMTVITSLRQYAFNLAVGPRNGRTPWVVRFTYPEVEAVPEEAPPPPPPPVALDFGYTMAGDAGLLPGRVWDDGRQTYFEFAEETAMPAIFAGADKDESLVNVSVRGRVAVVQQRAARFTLRAGKRIASVIKAEPQVAVTPAAAPAQSDAAPVLLMPIKP